jgi:two-component system NtrC family sensor kinase
MSRRAPGRAQGKSCSSTCWEAPASNLGLLRREWEQFASEASKAEEGLPSRLEDWAEILDESIEGVDRAATIVRDIRDFSHAGGTEPELVAPNRVLDQVLRAARAQLDPGIRVETDYGDVGLVMCEPQRLKQVFLNLVVNAGHAIGGAGRIRVSLRGEGDYVHAVVEDDGCGMRPEVRERIFDPFFTTKPVGSGTGLGLSIAHEIVRSHRGQIWCESEPGGGSAFHVRLPRRS